MKHGNVDNQENLINRCTICKVRTYSFCRCLDDSKLQVFSNISFQKEFSNGENIFIQNDPSQYLYNITEGNETLTVEIASVTNATESDTGGIETLTISDGVLIDETVCKQDLTYSGVAPDMWTGCYTTDSDENAIWEAACKLESVNASNYVYLYFADSSTCNFKWVRADDEIGDTWRELATSSANWSDSEFVIKHTGAKVHELKLCVNGVSGGPPDWCK